MESRSGYFRKLYNNCKKPSSEKQQSAGEAKEKRNFSGAKATNIFRSRLRVVLETLAIIIFLYFHSASNRTEKKNTKNFSILREMKLI